MSQRLSANVSSSAHLSPLICLPSHFFYLAFYFVLNCCAILLLTPSPNHFLSLFRGFQFSCSLSSLVFSFQLPLFQLILSYLLSASCPQLSPFLLLVFIPLFVLISLSLLFSSLPCFCYCLRSRK